MHDAYNWHVGRTMELLQCPCRLGILLSQRTPNLAAPPGHALTCGFQDLMPDGLHPNAAGMERLAQCLDPLVAELMAQPVVDFSTVQNLALARPQAPSSQRGARADERDA